MFYWDPNPDAFTIPFLELPIKIYGICFALGFLLGYFIFQRLLTKRLTGMPKETVQGLVDKLTWFVIGGTIIGARLGHVFLYDWERYKGNPWQILNLREGGLASHGGTIGVLLALGSYYWFFFRKATKRSFLELLDLIVIPTALVAFFIRLGNFFNQEIVGIPTDVPWAVVFGSPIDQPAVVPRHPAQLYEGLAYLATFFLLYGLSRAVKRPGVLTGLFFILIFGSRFLIEFVKAPQIAMLDQSFLQAGQLLSIPFIVGGFALLGFSLRKRQAFS